jgi:hypothetical protein
VAKRKLPAPKLRLTIQAIPKPLWGKNLRLLSKAEWHKIRGDAHTTCEICDATTQLSGHEVWEYVEKPRTGIARVIGIQHICQDCHSIHHFGRTLNLFRSGAIAKEEFYRIIRHFLTVNDCDTTVFERHVEETRKDWQRRSKLKWTISAAEFAQAALNLA